MALSKMRGWSREDAEALPLDEFWDAYDTSVAWEKEMERELHRQTNQRR